MGSAEDNTKYAPDYNFMKTLEVMNVPPDSEGADLRQAAKIACTFGLLPYRLEPNFLHAKSQAWVANQANWPLELDQEAFKNQKPNYLPIHNTYQDWFDAIRSALIAGKPENRLVGMGTQWSPDFETLPASAKLPDAPRGLYWGHAYVCVGWKNIGGFPYLVLKTWQGTGYGDGGYCYMSRTLCNKLMGAWGAYAFTLQDIGNAQTIPDQIVNLHDIIAALIQNALMSLKYGFSR